MPVSSLIDLMDQSPGGTPPPDNPAVLAAIQRQQSLLAQQGLQPSDAMRAAMQPGMSGYFDAGPNDNLTYRQFSPQDVAQQAGTTVGQLAANFGPRGMDHGLAQYPMPRDAQGRPSMQGGFFRAQDLYGENTVPTMFGRGASGLSTNNWRLLGMGPGYIMRNGNVINLSDALHGRGFWSGASLGSVAAEHGNFFPESQVGSGAREGAPNSYLGVSVGWPGGSNWTPLAWPASSV